MRQSLMQASCLTDIDPRLMTEYGRRIRYAAVQEFTL
jgi:hypothetical protein